MERRSLVALLALLPFMAPFTALSSARADMQAGIPPPLEIRVVRATHAGEGAPRSASWTVENQGSTPMRIRVGTTVCLFGGMRIPLRITGVRVEGRGAAREFNLPAGASVRVTVTFDGFSEAAARADSWRIELGLDVAGTLGGRVRNVAALRRTSGATPTRTTPR